MANLNDIPAPGTVVSQEQIVSRLVKWAKEHPNSREQTKRLASLATTHISREIKLKEGKTAEGLKNSKDRLSYKEGGLLYVVGRVRSGDEMCGHCSKGNGPFEHCVVLEGFMNGTCANCRYYDYQNKCKYKNRKFECYSALGILTNV